MKDFALIIGGLLIVLLALWGGAVGCTYIDKSSSAFGFAMVYTQLIAFIGGAAMCIIGISNRVCK